MTIEEELKQYIIENFGSITNFCKQIGMSQSTLSTIFKRGIQRTSITKIFAICDGLGISADAIAQGEIIPREMLDCSEYTDYYYIFDHMLVDGKKLNEYEIFHMKMAYDNSADLIRKMRSSYEPDFFITDSNGNKVFIEVKRSKK